MLNGGAVKGRGNRQVFSGRVCYSHEGSQFNLVVLRQELHDVQGQNRTRAGTVHGENKSLIDGAKLNRTEG